jgi:S-formylglutathione hydrolase
MAGAATLSEVEKHRAFGGVVGRYRHGSASTGTTMTFSVFEPPGQGPFPAVIYLAGLTCDDTTFLIKAGAQKKAAELGLMLIAPDTSPRGLDLPGIRESWDFGEAAGFYLDATEAPWATNFRMESYVTRDLLTAVVTNFPLDLARVGLMGHSMGGHGALTLGLKHPELFQTVSALAPIASPIQVPWGQKALPRYLGKKESAWRAADTVALLEDGRKTDGAWLVDQGTDDQFLAQQLRPDLLQKACKKAGQQLIFREHAGYDHGYYFIQTVIEDHLDHHFAGLTRVP